jgi:exodeoxyribonuclease V alpha subunit
MSDVSLADQLALWITRHGGDEVVAAWTRRLSLERARGHSCVLLEDHAGSEGLPGLDESLAALEASTLVGNGGAPTPLVVSGRLLWLYRDHVAEQRIALSIRERDMLSFDLHGRDRISGLFAQLYPDACASGAPLAAATALFGGLTILTGGPGTGKTTAVVRMLALLLANDPGLEIALAAPTGKAAARLQESIHGQLAGLPVGDELRERLRLDVRTVHGLLGIRPGSARIRHDADHPNPADVVVVDEASMVDLQIMDRLLAAVKPDARLILVGDRDQLASVDAGAVLADLVLARGTTDDVRSRGFAHRARVLGLEVKVEDSERPLGDALVELRRNYRFETRPGIASVATALREGDADRVLEILANDTTPDARRVDLDRGNLIGALDPLLDELPDPGVRDPALWLDLLEHRFRLLGATHAGPHGVTALNELVESRLRARGWGTDETWYPGRAILIERNHPGLGLANGDLGVCLAGDRDGRRVFHVRTASGEAPTALAVEQLPAHRTAWAMTLHKSQGSEFDHVLITLPPGGHPLLSRELLYTGITRAREQVTVFADEATIREAVHAVQRRRTGLAAALRGQ